LDREAKGSAVWSDSWTGYAVKPDGTG
jgi:hypothetical protein